MKEKIGTGAGLAIALVVAGTGAYLFFEYYTQFSFIASQLAAVSSEQQRVPVKTAPVVRMTAQKNPIPTTDFSRSKYQLSFAYPVVFYRQKEINGVSKYIANFASKSGEDDVAKRGKEDVQLSVVVDKKGHEVSEDSMKELEQLGVVQIEEANAVTVDGVSAAQHLLRVLRQDPGCDFRTDFMKSGVAYRISLFSVGGSCEAVRHFVPEYEALLQSFHVGK